ncbi:MAG: N-acetylmuramoyl-L-alanine amidase [Chloroflexota bacterium]|nr:N-acetylmuramoyl-L-alanine amidase [Chloroflexota bacterium]
MSRFFLIATGVAVFGLLVSIVFMARRPHEVVALAPAPIQTLLLLPTLTPTVTPTPTPPPIALLAGHSGGADTGAICPDGLREVDVTTDVAQRAKLLLEVRGYRVNILAEFDARLSATRRDYAPRVFLAIHADSCVYYASGYKVARAEFSAIPQEDDRLTRCVSSAYAAATQLPFHEGSITRDMTHYHGLNEIDAQSPAAIIELGFLGSDHDILKNKRDVLAMGITDGIDSFLRGMACQ